MARMIRPIRQLAAVLIFVFFADSCLHRDPAVTLTGGYRIAAISPGSPSDLDYTPWHDPREYSAWSAMRDLSRPDTGYLLVNDEDDEILEFDSEDSWRQAIREKKASSDMRMLRVHDVTGYRGGESFIIGRCAEGYFLVDVDDNWIEIYPGPAEWRESVAGRTQLDPNELYDPKSWLRRDREPVALAVYAGVLVLSLPWVLRRKSSAKSSGPDRGAMSEAG